MTCETIAKIVKASGVSAGELILIHFWGENADKTVADQFAAAVAALGASPVVLQQARSVNREIFAGAKESCFDDRYFGLFSKFDAVLDVFACQPIVLGYELEDAQMDLCGYTLLDEKMAGTFHIAVGANTMFGGENRATDHGDFVGRGEVEVLAAGVRYLRIEGACYVGIGCLFLLYGFYRAVKRPGMSVVLTVISLGVRVALAYLLAGPVGEVGIWAAIPIGWALADVTGYGYYLLRRAKLLPEE